MGDTQHYCRAVRTDFGQSVPYNLLCRMGRAPVYFSATMRQSVRTGAKPSDGMLSAICQSIIDEYRNQRFQIWYRTDDE